MSAPKVYEIAFHLAGRVNSSMRNSFNAAQKQLGALEERTRGVRQTMGKMAATTLKTASAMSVVTNSLGGLTAATAPAIAGMGALASSLASAGIGAAAFGAVAASAIGKVVEASEEVEKIEEKIANADSAKERLAAQKELAAVYADMSKEQQGALKNLQNFKSFWGSFVADFEKPVFNAFGKSLQAAQTALTALKPTITNVSGVVVEIVNNINAALKGSEMKAFFNWLEVNAAESLYNFSRIAGNTLMGTFNLLQAFAPLGASVEEGLIGMTERFRAWSAGLGSSKGFQTFIEYAKQNTPVLLSVLGNLGGIIAGVIKQVAPLGPVVLKVLDVITGLISKALNAGTAITGFGQIVQSVANGSSEDFQQMRDMAVSVFRNIAPVFKGVGKQVGSLLKSIGTGAIQAFSALYTFWKNNGPAIVEAMSNVFNTIGTVIGGVGSVVRTVGSVLKPVFQNIGSFAMSIVAQIISFWQTNGEQIIQAIQNVFAGINAVVKFLSPVILFIINSVWSSVKGVIQGALNVIMGAVKLFSGLFTGNFRLMWEGVKQLFFGAIQFVWNFVSLMFIGKILGGVKTLATGVINRTKGMWGSVKSFFTGGVNNTWNQIVNMAIKVKQGFTRMKDSAISLASRMWQGVKKYFGDIVSGARSLPGKIGAGITGMAGKAISGVTKLGNKMLKAIGKMVNGVIKGLNWIMGKIGIDTVIKSWTVPQYAKGTKSHPGGPAILGDGGGPELFRTPQGQVGLSPGTDTLMNLPKGTQVIPARETSQLMSMYNIPAYKTGNIIGNALNAGKEWLKDKAIAGKNWVVDKAGDVKDLAIDVFSYLSEPSKLLSKVLKGFGVGVPEIGGNLGMIASNSYSMIKNQAVEWLKGKFSSIQLADIGAGYTFGPPFRKTSGYGQRWGKLHKGVDWAAPTGTPIPSLSSGRVARAGWGARGSGFGGYGNFVLVDSGALSYLYAHNSKNLVKTGDAVRKGQTIGLVGSTGQSTGPHVHFEIRKNGKAINPDMLGGGGNFGNFRGGGAAMARAAITQALRILGKPMSLLQPLMTIAQKESGFNPNAINNWDINARRGDPSIGLFQIIGETFRRWTLPGFNNRRNPLHSAVAAIRYMDGRYGGVMNHPGIRSMMRGGGYKPYYKGGRVGYNQWALVGERGPELLRLPGGSQVFNNDKSKSMLAGLLSFTRQTSGNSSSAVKQMGNTQSGQYIYSPQIIIQGDADEAVIEQANLNAFEKFKQWFREIEEEKRRKNQLVYQ